MGEDLASRTTTRLSLIGPGRVGQTLARALHDRGVDVVDVVGRRPDRVREAVRFIGAGAGRVDLREIGADFDVLLLGTGDDALAELADELAELQIPLAGKHALHFSGCHPASILSPLRERGMRIGSMHPLVSFPEPLPSLAGLAEAFYCLEGETAAVERAAEWVTILGGRSFTVAEGGKVLYHAAAVLACGQLAALLDLSFSIWQAIGIDRETSRAALLPLIRSTVRALETASPQAAMTGPFARGDLATVRLHLEALERVAKTAGNEDALAVYRALGRRAASLASPSLEPEVRSALFDLLARAIGEGS